MALSDTGRGPEVGEHLSGPPTSVGDDDEEAKRFDLLMLRLQRNIPVISAQVELLDDIASDD